jgi:hypothetical protein
LIGGAPGTLDTLNELAAAINDDANYNSTLTTALATKLPLAGGTMTGALTIGTSAAKIFEVTRTGSATYDFTVTDGGDGGAQLYVNAQTNDTGFNFRPKNSSGTNIDALFIDPDGNVGLGITNPGNQLHLKHANGPTIQLTRTSTNASSGNIGDIVFGNADWDSSMARIGARQDGTNDGGKLEFSTQSTAAGGELVRMIIHRDGQLKLGYQSIGGSVGTAGVILSDAGRNSTLGTTLGDTQRVVQFHNLSQNQDYLTFRTRRITDGQSGWNHSAWDITRDIDNTSDVYRYMTFGIGDVVINDFGANMDFRVESNTNANMLFVDGGTNRVGIGIVPETTLDVNGTIRLTPNSADRNYTADIAARYDSAHPFEITVENNGSSAEYFGVYADSGGSNNRVAFMTGNVGIGTNDPDHKLDVNGVIGIKSNAVIDSDGTSHYFKTPSGGAMYFYHGTTNIMYVSSAGLLPSTDNARDLGSTSNRWRNLYTTDLHLSNEGKPEGNQVDGTTGNWTIQEGEENLYIINNKSGKKYKFALEEIS